MREVISAVGSGVVDVIHSRSSGRIQTEKVTSAFCNLVVGAGSVAADAQASHDFPVLVQRDSAAKKDQAAGNLLINGAAAFSPRRCEKLRVKQIRLTEAPERMPRLRER